MLLLLLLIASAWLAVTTVVVAMCWVAARGDCCGSPYRHAGWLGDARRERR